MWLPFILENLRFTLFTATALVTAASAWLHFDAWSAAKTNKNALRFAGYLVLSFSFALSALILDTSIFGQPILFSHSLPIVATIIRIVGYLLITTSLILDPMQKQPTLNALLPLAPGSIVLILSPLAALSTAVVYFRRAYAGLEKHLRLASHAFFVLTIFELLSQLRPLLENSSNTNLFTLAIPFGPLWIAELVLVLIYLLLIRTWVFSYLLKRFSSQLIITFTSVIVVSFLVTTLIYTSLLLNNVQSSALYQLNTDAKALLYALSSRQETILSDTQAIASNPEVVRLISTTNRTDLAKLLQSLLLAKSQSSVTAVKLDGTVIAHGENLEKFGESVVTDPQFMKAASGTYSTSLVTKNIGLYTTIFFQAAAPISDQGVLIVSTPLDNAFVDQLKSSTGLEASIFANNVLTSTSFTLPNSNERPIGTKETNPKIISEVLTHNRPFTSSIQKWGHLYLSSYLPLTNVDNTPIGMLSVSKDQIDLLKTAGQAIQTTFTLTLLLLIFSLLPAYLVSQSITKQIR